MAEPGQSPIERFEFRAARLFLRRLMALTALAGGLAALGHAPFNLWPVALLGLSGLFAMFRVGHTAARAFWIGWAGGTGYFAVALFWIVEPFFVDFARHGWMAPFALVFLSGGLALFWGVAFWAARRAGGRPLAWIAALTLAEILRSYVLTGFPWALLGYAWAASPAAIYAAYIGPHGLTAAALAVAVTLWRLLTPARLRALPMLGLYALLLAAAIPLGRPASPPADAPVIRLVQPNAPQHQKWDPAHINGFFERQLRFTAAAPEGPAPDLVVWPETAIPWFLDNAGEPLRMISQAAGGTPVVLGLRRLDGPRLYNSLVVLDPAGQVRALYDKHHLVPFGEYIPMGNIAAQMGIHGLATNEGYGYSSGPGPRLVSLPGIGRALPLICYEAVFPQGVGAAPARPRVLLQITNDAWFGQFSGPYQHLQQARMRAIEQGLPMLRVANTGVSAMIGPRGSVSARLALGTAGYTDAALPPVLPPTPYARTGDAPIALLMLLALGLAWWRRAPAK
ncbi:apolipoprotein N-acyltransferase [Marimonas lutisalis]|uniref:apolipoprotein N-acyltransferase n=1 Tax=Marimonas lutisalis TaxID=2545756 RepID=UPI0010F674C2|nr:apolipoprotein N-acyltransferase [Marimonas lutisalis]